MTIETDVENVNNGSMSTGTVPLVVDLDGTFLNTDILYEAIVVLLKHNPLMIFLCFFWVWKGKLNLKKEIFKHVTLNYAQLPVNEDVHAFLKNEASKGREIILATASLLDCGKEICSIYPCLGRAYGSKDNINLSGKYKSDFLVSMFGQNGFDYIGNSRSDLAVFENSRYSYLKNPSNRVERRADKIGAVVKVWKPSKSKLFTITKSLRVYQWVKNCLIFIPLLISHSFFTYDLVIRSVIAFMAFSLVASAGYLLNDIMDVESDRSHKRKKNRPIANGDLDLLSGMTVVIILLLVGLCISLLLASSFTYVLISYFIVSLAYSMYLKKVVLLDVFLLTSFYTIRVISGGVVTGIPVSFWLVAFSIFLFLSLAFIKRYSELWKKMEKDDKSLAGRAYKINDMGLLKTMGVSGGYMSVIVFSLYLNSSEVRLLYKSPEILWFISFLILFWISRMWLVTDRGQMHDDPIVYAIRDKSSYAILGLTAILLLLAKVAWF